MTTAGFCTIALHTLLAGAVIASLDVGGSGYQPVSLAAGAGMAYVDRPDGSVTLLDATNGLAGPMYCHSIPQ